MFQSVRLQWGWLPLVGGAILLLLAAGRKGADQSREGAVGWVRKALTDIEPFFYSMNRPNQLEVVHRFARRIDLGPLSSSYPLAIQPKLVRAS